MNLLTRGRLSVRTIDVQLDLLVGMDTGHTIGHFVHEINGPVAHALCRVPVLVLDPLALARVAVQCSAAGALAPIGRLIIRIQGVNGRVGMAGEIGQGGFDHMVAQGLIAHTEHVGSA